MYRFYSLLKVKKQNGKNKYWYRGFIMTKNLLILNRIKEFRPERFQRRAFKGKGFES